MKGIYQELFEDHRSGTHQHSPKTLSKELNMATTAGPWLQTYQGKEPYAANKPTTFQLLQPK